MIKWLREQIEKERATARSAIDPERPGVQWHWVTNETDTPVAPGDLEEAQQHQVVSLRTVEEFKSPWTTYSLPRFLLYAEEVDPGAGEHIARHDPRSALARCDAFEKLLELHPQSSDLVWTCELCGSEGQNIDCTYPCDTVRLLALSYRHQPGFRWYWCREAGVVDEPS